MKRTHHSLKLALRKHMTLTLASLSFAACIGLPAIPVSAALQKQAQNYTQRPLKLTANHLDFAIDGVGFFAVLDTKKSKRYYTRKGNFKLDHLGNIVTQEGFKLDPAFALTPDFKLVLLEGGVLWAVLSNGEEGAMARLTLTRFAHPKKLKKVNKLDAYYEATGAAGAPEEGSPGQNGFGLTINKALEDLSKPAISLPASPCLKPTDKRKITHGDLDWSIQGKGYFKLLHPVTGERLFTRQARLQINQQGELVSQHGYKLDLAFKIPLSSEKGKPVKFSFSRVSPAGHIWAEDATGLDTWLGTITLSLIDKPGNLQAMSFTRMTVLRLNPLAGDKVPDVYPGEGGSGTVVSGAYEDCGNDLLTLPPGFYQNHMPDGL